MRFERQIEPTQHQHCKRNQQESHSDRIGECPGSSMQKQGSECATREKLKLNEAVVPDGRVGVAWRFTSHQGSA